MLKVLATRLCSCKSYMHKQRKEHLSRAATHGHGTKGHTCTCKISQAGNGGQLRVGFKSCNAELRKSARAIHVGLYE